MSSEEEEFGFEEGADDDDDDESFQEGNDDDDDEEEEEAPVVEKRIKVKISMTKTKKVDDDSDDSSDEEMTLAELARRRMSSESKKKATPKKKSAPAKKKTVAKKKASPKKKTSTARSTSSSSGGGSGGVKKYDWASAALYGTECIKGMLIQRLLCRWWYAITWPDPSDLPAQPPPHCDSLDGFPGVYIATSGESVGQIHDIRDRKKCPSFGNLAQKSAEELRELLLRALEEQQKQLVSIEGAGTATEKELTTMIKWAKKINAKKADNEAQKVLKASRLSLP